MKNSEEVLKFNNCRSSWDSRIFAVGSVWEWGRKMEIIFKELHGWNWVDGGIAFIDDVQISY